MYLSEIIASANELYLACVCVTVCLHVSAFVIYVYLHRSHATPRFYLAAVETFVHGCKPKSGSDVERLEL